MTKVAGSVRRAGRSDLPPAMVLGSMIGLLVAAVVRGLLESSDVPWAGTDSDAVGGLWFVSGMVFGAGLAAGFARGTRQPPVDADLRQSLSPPPLVTR